MNLLPDFVPIAGLFALVVKIFAAAIINTFITLTFPTIEHTSVESWERPQNIMGCVSIADRKTLVSI